MTESAGGNLTLAAPNISEDEFQRVRDLVYRHCGIHLKDGKQDLVRARVARRLRTGGFPSVSAYLDFVRQDASGREFSELIDAISTNLTSFFRESSHFTYLREQYIPQMLERKRARGSNRIRAWSAGCSTGEEPYSLAMLLHETVPAANWDVKILATDVSGRVLRIAREGIYKETQIRAVPAPMRAKYLNLSRRESQGGYFIVPAIREHISFNYLNLMDQWPFKGPFDFIFCRNVMIYFDEPTQKKLVNRFYSVLHDGGLLFTGHSESLSKLETKFEYVQPTIYTRTPQPVAERKAA